MKVIINPGHSTTDPGFMGPTGLYEHEVVLAVSHALERALRERQIEAEVLPQPGGNTKWALNHLMQQVNQRGEEIDFFLSLHCAADKQREAYGTRVHYLANSEEGRLLAEKIHQHFPRTAWSKPLPSEDYVLQQAPCTAVIIDVDYLSNADVEMLMRTDPWREKVAENVVEGLFEFIGGSHDIRLFIDGKEVFSDPPPQIVFADVMVPVRLLADAFGAHVEWDREKRILHIHRHPQHTPSSGSARGNRV